MQGKPNQSYSTAEQLGDRVRHAIVFCEATLRMLQETLELIEQKEGEQ